MRAASATRDAQLLREHVGPDMQRGHHRQRDAIGRASVAPLPERDRETRQLLRIIDAQPDSAVAHVREALLVVAIEQSRQTIADDEHELHTGEQLRRNLGGRGAEGSQHLRAAFARTGQPQRAPSDEYSHEQGDGRRQRRSDAMSARQHEPDHRECQHGREHEHRAQWITESLVRTLGRARRRRGQDAQTGFHGRVTFVCTSCASWASSAVDHTSQTMAATPHASPAIAHGESR